MRRRRSTSRSATTAAIDLAVSYYGGGIGEPYWADMPSGISLAGGLRTPWLGFYGGRDPITPEAELRALADASSNAPVPGRVVVYEGADHGFALDEADCRYDADAAGDAARRVRAALDSLAGE